MALYPSADLLYGVNLGDLEWGWKLQVAGDEDPAWMEDEDPMEAITRCLLEDSGMTPEEAEENAYRSWVLKERTGVEVVVYGHHDEPRYALASWAMRAHAYEPATVNLGATPEEDDPKLRAALEGLGLVPCKPSYLLTVSYG